jgi:hypothetical protein
LAKDEIDDLIAAAVLVTLFAVLGGPGGFFSGVADASDFSCARHIGWLSCPVGQ